MARMRFRERIPGTPPRDVAQSLNVSVTNVIPLGPRLYENLDAHPNNAGIIAPHDGPAKGQIERSRSG
jgi:hypothetical protein